MSGCIGSNLQNKIKIDLRTRGPRSLTRIVVCLQNPTRGSMNFDVFLNWRWTAPFIPPSHDAQQT